MKTLRVGNIELGKGPPKICVPIMGESMGQLTESTVHAIGLDADMYEWRADHFKTLDHGAILAGLAGIRDILGDKPLIFTLRSVEEGGAGVFSEEEYAQINEAVATSGLADIIDVELCKNQQTITGLSALAHHNNVYILLSAHYFKGTPTKDELLATLLTMQGYPADILKLAVMAESETDVLSIFEVSLEMRDKYAERPFAVIGMGNKGVLTRIAGGFFGSSFTFAKGEAASAPGQPDISIVRRIIDVLSEEGTKDQY